MHIIFLPLCIYFYLVFFFFAFVFLLGISGLCVHIRVSFPIVLYCIIVLRIVIRGRLLRLEYIDLTMICCIVYHVVCIDILACNDFVVIFGLCRHRYLSEINFIYIPLDDKFCYICTNRSYPLSFNFFYV